MLRNSWNEIQFFFRSRGTGKLAVHRKLPRIKLNERLRKEWQYYHLILSKAIGPDESQNISQVWDVGCRNWSYIHSLGSYFPNASLVGVEVDGARRYWNLYRRIDFAEAYAEDLRKKGRSVHVLGEDFRTVGPLLLSVKEDQSAVLPPEEVLFCFFYPFVSENPCLSWGLPTRFVDFAGLLLKAQKLAEVAGVRARFLSIHQGEWEVEEARAAYRRCSLVEKESLVRASEFKGLWPSPYDTYILSSS